MTGELGGDWRALHVFTPQPELQEALLTGTIASCLEAAGVGRDRWFFIRYAEAGFHLRLRVRGLASAAFDAFEQDLRSGAAEVLAPPLDIRRVPYEPEVVRYGGAEALEVNEGLFSLSSELALQVVRQSEAQSTRRTTQAFDLMLVAAVCIGLEAEDAFAYFGRYAEGWRRLLAPDMDLPSAASLQLSRAALEQRLAAVARRPGEDDQRLSARWTRALDQATGRFREIAARDALVSPISGTAPRSADTLKDAIGSMVTSQMHMLNNRLGVSPVQEYLLARAAAACAEPQDRPTTAPLEAGVP